MMSPLSLRVQAPRLIDNLVAPSCILVSSPSDFNFNTPEKGWCPIRHFVCFGGTIDYRGGGGGGGGRHDKIHFLSECRSSAKFHHCGKAVEVCCVGKGHS